MPLLLDTHALIWWLAGDTALSVTARQAILNSPGEVFVSAATAWEVTTKNRIGKLPNATLLAVDVAAAVASQGFRELSISVHHGQSAGALPGIHKDPFDRILVAQAMIEGMNLVSNDAMLRAYGVSLLW